MERIQKTESIAELQDLNQVASSVKSLAEFSAQPILSHEKNVKRTEFLGSSGSPAAVGQDRGGIPQDDRRRQSPDVGIRRALHVKIKARQTLPCPFRLKLTGPSKVTGCRCSWGLLWRNSEGGSLKSHGLIPIRPSILDSFQPTRAPCARTGA